MERDSVVDRKSSSLGMWDVGMYAIPRIPLIKAGDEIGRLIFDRASADSIIFRDKDILVVAHKVISKAEGAVARLADVTPSPRAHELSQATGRDPRLCVEGSL